MLLRQTASALIRNGKMAKSGKQAKADLESTIHQAHQSANRAAALRASGASDADKKAAVDEAQRAIRDARVAQVTARYASTGSNPDLGGPLEKAALAHLVKLASGEIGAANARTFGWDGE